MAVTRLPLQLGSVLTDLECAVTPDAVAKAIVSAAFVEAPVAGDNPRIVFGPSVPTDGTPLMWVRTAAPSFIALRENGEWVANVGQGSVRVIADTVTGADLSNAAMREMTEAQKTAAGLTGRWAYVDFPPITGVRYR